MLAVSSIAFLILSCLPSIKANHNGLPSSHIPFNVLIGGRDALQLFFGFNETIVEQLLAHGCWCAKLNLGHKNSVKLGGTPIDEIDQLCKLWITDRRCMRIEGGSCYSALESNNTVIFQ